MSKILTINYTSNPPVVDSYAGEIGENRAVTLKIFPDIENNNVSMFVMNFAVEGGIIPSRAFSVNEELKIELTSVLTQQEILACQLVGLSADGETVITKTPIVKLYLGETLTGEVVVDPVTGDTIFDEIAELKEIADALPTVPTKTSQLTNDSGFITSHQDISGKADKTYVDGQLATKQNTISSSNKLDYSLIANTPTIPTVPTNVSAFTNDAGYLTSHQDISGKADTYYVDTQLLTKADKSNTYTKTETNSAISDHHDISKQDKLTAGSNITITNNVISASGGVVGVYEISEAAGEAKDIPENILTKKESGYLLTYLGYVIDDYAYDEELDRYVGHYRVISSTDGTEITSDKIYEIYMYADDVTIYTEIDYDVIDAVNGKQPLLPNGTSEGQVLTWNGSAWANADAPSGGGATDYSTTEQMTGQKWIDGRDIYCVTNLVDINGGRFKSNGVNLLGVTEVLWCDGFIINSNIRYKIPHYQSSSFFISAYAVKGSAGNANYSFDKAGSWTGSIYLTVYYLKD